MRLRTYMGILWMAMEMVKVVVDYVASYTTQMLADFDADGAITVEDLSRFVIGLDERDIAYELGPFTGEIPHVFVELDQQFNIEHCSICYDVELVFFEQHAQFSAVCG